MISTRSSLALKNSKFFRAFVFTFGGIALTAPLQAAVAASDFPVYVTAVANPNDYSLFANSGWDGNWYAGYNNCWIKKLPPIPEGTYVRAYAGAKLGRMKNAGPVGKPPEFPAIPGSFRMAIASTGAWKTSESVQIARTDEIPLEGHLEFAIEGTGESQWFWAQIPVDRINPRGDNYLVVWSPTPALVQASSAPIIAAANGGKKSDTWLCQNNAGAPPSQPSKEPGVNISFFQPALGLKLIPQGPAHPVNVRLISWRAGTADNIRPVITASVLGESIESAWVEYGVRDQWRRAGRALWKAPYIFSLDPRPLPRGRLKLRVAAVNVWGEIGYSDAFIIEIGEVRDKK